MFEEKILKILKNLLTLGISAGRLKIAAKKLETSVKESTISDRLLNLVKPKPKPKLVINFIKLLAEGRSCHRCSISLARI